MAVQRSHGIPAPPTRSRASRREWDVIVVGSGVGGSVTAGLLASHGAQVLVLEKNDRPGGILASYERDGFKIDVGSHLVSRGAKGPLGLALREAALTRPRFLTHDIPLRSRGMFAATAPRTRGQLPRVGLQAARTLGLSAKETAAVARLLFEVFTLTEWELRRWDGRSLEEFILRHTYHPGTYFLFSFMASIFFVLPPWEVSAGEAIRDLRHVLLDYSLSYVEGGMDSLCHALLGRVHDSGGEVVVGQRVVEVRPRVGASVVVSTEDGAEYEAHAVALNLAPSDAVKLVAGFPEDYVARAQKLRPSGNAHQLKLALKRPLVEEGCIIGGVSLSGRTLKDLSLSLMHDSVEAIAEGRVSDPLAVYAPVPSNYDPELAPEGAQLIVASIYAPVRENPADPPELWGKQSLLAMEQIIPGLRDELLFADFSPVPRVGAWMGKSSNAAVCNGQTPGQVGRDRLPVRTPLPGIYLCGDGAGGRGIGTELAASSAMEAVAAIEEQRRAG